MNKPITLQPGDYVNTDGMTKEQYAAVAEAFMKAGARQGEYPGWNMLDMYPMFGWLEGSNSDRLFHSKDGFHDGRELTVEQILGTER